ncbi:MAG: hypothetical protein HZC49_06165 [Nitrospirae bacterium]|nr:hypothetical protein [Nitrospirota bacterium]
MAVDVLPKKEHVRRVMTRIDEWVSRLALLHTEAREAGEAARIGSEMRIADFREALEDFQAKMRKIEEADDRKWEAQRTDAYNAFYSLEDTFRKVSGDIRKMIRGASSEDDASVPGDEDEWDH